MQGSGSEKKVGKRTSTQAGEHGPGQLTMQVVDHVRELIERGEVKPGDRLPPERELAQRLKISRPSLRAGLGFLAAMGVLRSRHGAGTFIADGPPALDPSTFSVLGSLHSFLPWQMFEARLVLEAGVAALAAERATQQQIASLAEEVLEMEGSLEDPQQYLIHDVRFHRTIAQAARNPILSAVMETITARLYDARRRTVAHSASHKEAAASHREIYRAIRARNAERARLAMERHLRFAQAAHDQEPGSDEIEPATSAAPKEMLGAPRESQAEGTPDGGRAPKRRRIRQERS